MPACRNVAAFPRWTSEQTTVDVFGRNAARPASSTMSASVGRVPPSAIAIRTL